MASKIVKFQGMKVRLPKRATKLSAPAKLKIQSMDQKLSKSAKCVITFFDANIKNGRRTGKPKLVPVQRCEGRRLKAHNKRQCRKGGKSKATRYLFAKCTPQRKAAMKRRRR